MPFNQLLTFVSKTNRSAEPAKAPDASLCTTCSVLNISAILRETRASKDMIPLGCLTDIIQKANRCRFCHLISSLFRRCWCLDALPKVDLSGVLCSLSTVSIGTLADLADVEERKRCHRLQIGFSDRPQEVVRTMERMHMGLRLEIQLLEEDAQKVRRTKELHGRRMNDVVDISLVTRWLALCEKEHGDACAHVWWGGTTIPLPRFVRMIDVVSLSLVQAPSNCRYVALSYVWGMAGDSYWTTKTNMGPRSRPAGINPSVFPATIADAIRVTKGLSERYLWIDALCIIQDSPDDKGDQICVMDLIYNKAFLTIFAAGGESAQAKLPGLSQGSRTVHQHIEVVQGLHLALPLPTLKEAIMQSTWDTRGWTMQELMISRRRLFFTNHQVYFECAKDAWCEDIVAESKTVAHSSNPVRYFGSGAAPFLYRPMFPDPDYMSSYVRLIERYTQRRLSFPSDVILAITALTNTMTRGYQLAGGDPAQAFRYGMQIRDLERSLLWQPRLDLDHALTRRVNTDTRLSAWPSWAWTGWIGPVLYSSISQFTSAIIMNTPQVKPVESLVKGWYLADDNHRLIHLDVNTIRFLAVHRERVPSARYVPPAGDIDERALGALPPAGTLVFRTQSASFKVSKLEMARKPDNTPITSAPYAIYEIVSDVRRRSTRVGRIILPSMTPSPSLLTFVVLARCNGLVGFYDEGVYERYDGGLLYLIAVRRTGGREPVVERVGLGAICEQAWLECNAKVETVFLG